jgi:peptidoglycan hydrolase-like protein with peptidoglycan-binding domain
MRTAAALALGVGVLAYGAATETPEPAAAACTINSTLRAGSSGTQVACLEQTLKAKGLQSTYIDSYFGTITRTTIIDYQRSKGFVADGVVGQQTAQSLGIWATSVPATAPACTISTTLRAGSSGTQVACLERTLKAKGLQFTYIDSYFGTITRTTIINYQRSKGLYADGTVGQQTAQSLGIWATSAPAAAAPTYNCIQFGLSTPNSWRTSAGIPALRDGFYSGACSWAKSMAKSGIQSHDPGLPSTTGEVIYRWYGTCDAATAFTAWRNSAPHRAVILTYFKGFTTYGAFACVEAGGRAYAVGRIGF